MDSLVDKLKRTKATAITLGNLSDGEKRRALEAIADAVAKDKQAAQEANRRDVDAARAASRSAAYLNRLTLTDKVFDLMVEQIRHVATLPDPVGVILERRMLPNGIELEKRTVPIGVIGIIYESRPNVTTDVVALSLRSGNAVVLRGSSSALNSNRVLVASIHRGLEQAGVPKEAVLFLDAADREVVNDIVQQDAYVDVIIPRGGYELVKKVQAVSRIPVLYHAAGGARIYVDESADLKQA